MHSPDVDQETLNSHVAPGDYIGTADGQSRKKSDAAKRDRGGVGIPACTFRPAERSRRLKKRARAPRPSQAPFGRSERDRAQPRRARGEAWRSGGEHFFPATHTRRSKVVFTNSDDAAISGVRYTTRTSAAFLRRDIFLTRMIAHEDSSREKPRDMLYYASHFGPAKATYRHETATLKGAFFLRHEPPRQKDAFCNEPEGFSFH